MDVDQNILNQIFTQIGTITQSISQLNHDYTTLSQQQASLDANVAWLMKFFWIIASASIGSFVATLWQILQNRKKK